MGELVFGGISGAIIDPFSDEADKHAEMFYEEMRHNHSDVEKIANNTNIPVEDVLHVKNFLFFDVHLLESGEIRRFDASFAIAESWRRLAFDKEHIQKHDITLLKHELYERKLMSKGINQHKAHEITSKKYDYPSEVKVFYEKMKKDKVIPKTKFDAGALRYADFER